MLKVDSNPVWSAKRAGGKITYATIAELQIIASGRAGKFVNFVWQDEGEFKKTGEPGVFKLNKGALYPPLMCTEEDATTILFLYDKASPVQKEKLAGMIQVSRRSFGIVFDAAIAFRESAG